jgi:hypothetical protein
MDDSYTLHQKRDVTIVWGNWKGDREAKKAALTRGQSPTVLMASLILSPLAKWDPLCIPQEQV